MSFRCCFQGKFLPPPAVVTAFSLSCAAWNTH